MLGRISNPLIELLAITLYEHDHRRWPPAPKLAPAWGRLSEPEREIYREMARGERHFGYSSDGELARDPHVDAGGSDA